MWQVLCYLPNKCRNLAFRMFKIHDTLGVTVPKLRPAPQKQTIYATFAPPKSACHNTFNARMKQLFTFLILLGYGSLFAQNFENYEPQRSSGKLPEDFTRAVTEAVKASEADIPGKKTREDKEFILSSAFSLNRIMLGGKVLFNDPMSAFANRVADGLLKNDPALRAKVRIYIVKSPYVNAFATSEGAIFINIGLLAQLENEAQLAYILAHEIVHVDKKHSLDEFKKKVDISQGKGVYRDLSNSEKLLARSAYSKEKEQEADELGFLDFYDKSGYSYAAIAGVFDILKYGHLPIDEIAFDKSFFENPGFNFPKSYTLAELTPINTDDEEEDEESTHPALAARRAVLEKLIATRNNEGRKDYVVGESEFTRIRNIARFELCRLQLLEADYNNAIYNAYVLLKQFPGNRYLLKVVGHSLFWISFNNENLGKSFYKDTEGESQQLAYLLYKLSSKQKDLDMVTVAFATRLKQLFPTDSEIDLLLKESIRHTVESHEIDDKDLYTVYMNSLSDSVKNVQAEKVDSAAKEKKADETRKTKYQKIAGSKTAAKTVLNGDPADSLNFHRYVLAAYMDSIRVRGMFRDAYAKMKDDDARESSSERARRRGLDYKYGKAAGPVRKVIVVDPYYFGIVVGKDKKIKYLKNEQEEKDLVDRIEECGKAAGIATDIIEPKTFTEDDVEKYNEMVILDEWLGERMLSDSRDIESASQTPVTSIGYNQIKKIIDAHGTEYAMWTVSLFEQRSRKRGPLIAMMAIFPPLIPILIHRAINGGSVSHFMALAFNLETGELKLSNSKTIWDNNYAYVKNSNIYFVFHQLKQTDKK